MSVLHWSAVMSRSSSRASESAWNTAPGIVKSESVVAAADGVCRVTIRTRR